VAAGDVSDYTPDVVSSLEQAIATRASVEPSAVAALVTSASVTIEFVIATTSAAAASAIQTDINSALTMNPNSLFAGVTNSSSDSIFVESVTRSATVSSRPAPPSSSPLHSTSPNLSSIGIVVISVAGAVALIVIILRIGIVAWKKSSRQLSDLPCFTIPEHKYHRKRRSPPSPPAPRMRPNDMQQLDLTSEPSSAVKAPLFVPWAFQLGQLASCPTSTSPNPLAARARAAAVDA